jgi:lipoate-protein ligase A
MRSSSVIRSTHHNPYENLALEEYLRRSRGSSSPLLYLWQNEKTVVFGRNQNPWRECHLDLLAQEGGLPARRASGGGAVFHDLGNLNFTFILPTPLFDISRQISVIAQALKQFGIATEQSGRNDLLAGGAKFSGNAWYKARDVSYHHGTLLVKVDMAFLGRYLLVSPAKLRSKGITSVQSRVINLASLREDLTIEALSEALGQSFTREYDLSSGAPMEATFEELRQDPLFEELREHFAGESWIFGNSPAFDLVLENRFAWGGLELLISSAKGKITSLAVNSDALETQVIAKIPPLLEGSPFRPPLMGEKLRHHAQTLPPGEGREILEEIALWLLSGPLHEKPS